MKVEEKSCEENVQQNELLVGAFIFSFAFSDLVIILVWKRGFSYNHFCVMGGPITNRTEDRFNLCS